MMNHYRIEKREVRRPRRSSATRTARANEFVFETRWFVVRESDGRELRTSYAKKRQALLRVKYQHEFEEAKR